MNLILRDLGSLGRVNPTLVPYGWVRAGKKLSGVAETLGGLLELGGGPHFPSLENLLYRAGEPGRRDGLLDTSDGANREAVTEDGHGGLNTKERIRKQGVIPPTPKAALFCNPHDCSNLSSLPRSGAAPFCLEICGRPPTPKDPEWSEYIVIGCLEQDLTKEGSLVTKTKGFANKTSDRAGAGQGQPPPEPKPKPREKPPPNGKCYAHAPLPGAQKSARCVHQG